MIKDIRDYFISKKKNVVKNIEERSILWKI